MTKSKASGLGVTHLNRPTATSDNMCYVAFGLGSCITGGNLASLAILPLRSRLPPGVPLRSDGHLGLPWAAYRTGSRTTAAT